MHTVLIVEDEMLVSVGLRNLIPWDDMDMVIIGEAQDGAEGLEMYRQKKPDIILTDIKMPVMDGVEMIRRIRENDTSTKIIVLSSYEDFNLVRETFVLGISDYFLKLKMMPEEMKKVMLRVRDEIREERGKSEDDLEESEDQISHEHKLEAGAYIMDQNGSMENFREKAIKLNIKECNLCACMMEIFPSTQKQRRAESVYYERVKQIVCNLIQVLLTEYERGEVWIEHGNRFLIVFSFGDMESRNDEELLLEEIITRIRMAITSCVNMKAVFGVSSSADTYEALHTLYLEAKQALAKAISTEQNVLYCTKRSTSNAGEEKENLRWEIEKAIAYISAHYNDADISLSTVASEVAIHKDYLSKLFKKEMGVGFSHYLNMLRISKAQDLLEGTHLRSYEVGRRVGFQDECYFSRVFKKVTGMGPNEYKKSLKIPEQYQ